MSFNAGCASEGEPTCIYWLGQADTARLKARFWLQYGIINCIVFGICILFTWLVYAFPVIGTILGYIVSPILFEACLLKRIYSHIYSILF